MSQDYMQEALDLARQGQGRTSPNPTVGAVLARAHELNRVAAGAQSLYHQADGPGDAVDLWRISLAHHRHAQTAAAGRELVDVGDPVHAARACGACMKLG